MIKKLLSVLLLTLIAGSAHTVTTEKGGFQHAPVEPTPAQELDLGPVQEAVATEAAKRCGTYMAAQPLEMGDAAGFGEQMAGKVASAAVGKLLGGLMGGGGGSKKKPDLYKDEIKKKHKEKFKDEPTNTQVSLGGQLFKDGLLLSSRVDKSKGKSTFHTMFLERPDCTRIFPVRQMGYGLWGEWSLSVSITKTTRSYQDGKLVGESVEKSGWSKAGTFDFSNNMNILIDDGVSDELKLVLDPAVAYLNQLKSQIGTPMWQEMGYGEPMKGLRAVGAVFEVSPADISPDTIAVIHVTRVEKGQYTTVGFPFNMAVGGEGMVSFKQIPAPTFD
jgi:hypothetical protein